MPTRICYAPGTCGEWVYGWHEGEPVSISCPVENYVIATISPCEQKGIMLIPEDCLKARAAAEKILADNQLQYGGFTIVLDDPLPRGRGYASSTADIISSSAVLGLSLGMDFSAEDLGRLACTIEPSHGLMFPYLGIFGVLSGKLHMEIGHCPRLPLLILDPERGNRPARRKQGVAWKQLSELEHTTSQALELFRQGITSGDWRLLGEAAAVSSDAYQRIEPSELIEKAQGWANDIHAAGPLRAHTGSIAGLLFPCDEAAREAKAWLSEYFQGKLFLTHTANGGLRYELG